MNKNTYSENELQAFVDGKLNASQSEKIRRFLDENPQQAERIADYKKQNVLLEQLHGKPDDAVLKRVKANFRKKRYTKATALPYVASIVWLISGLSIGLMLNLGKNQLANNSFNIQQHAISAHVVYTPEVRHPVEVGVDQEAHLVKWLSKRLNRKLKLPDLKSLGYELVGGRLLPADLGPAAMFMYQNYSGERLTLYIIAQPAQDTAFQFFKKNKVNVFSWNDTNMGFAIVGSIAKDKLYQAANMVYGELVI